MNDVPQHSSFTRRWPARLGLLVAAGLWVSVCLWVWKLSGFSVADLSVDQAAKSEIAESKQAGVENTESEQLRSQLQFDLDVAAQSKSVQEQALAVKQAIEQSGASVQTTSEEHAEAEQEQAKVRAAAEVQEKAQSAELALAEEQARKQQLDDYEQARTEQEQARLKAAAEAQENARLANLALAEEQATAQAQREAYEQAKTEQELARTMQEQASGRSDGTNAAKVKVKVKVKVKAKTNEEDRIAEAAYKKQVLLAELAAAEERVRAQERRDADERYRAQAQARAQAEAKSERDALAAAEKQEKLEQLASARARELLGLEVGVSPAEPVGATLDQGAARTRTEQAAQVATLTVPRLRTESRIDSRVSDAEAGKRASAEASRIARVARQQRAYEAFRNEEMKVLLGLSARLKFPSRSKSVSTEMERTLDRMFEPLYLYSEVPVTVTVSTNEFAGVASDNTLSRDRGRELVNYFVSRGLEKDRFRIRIEAGEKLPNGAHRVRVSSEEAGQ